MKSAWLSLGGALVLLGCGSGGGAAPANSAGSSSGGAANGMAGSSTGAGMNGGGNQSQSGSATGGSAGSGTAGSGTGGGGASTGGSGTGGGGAGTSGSGTGGGGAGGTTAKGFECPTGASAITPVIPASAGSPIANVPPAGFNPDNLEGPVWIKGYLYLSEIAKRANGQAGQDQPQGGRIIRLQPGQAAEVFLMDVGTNGLAVNPAGDLMAASQKEGGVVSFDLTTPVATPKKVYANMFEGKRFSSPNDLAVRNDGNIYFTDPSYQAGSVKQSAERAYRIDPAGTVSAIAAAPSPPNGITLSPDQKTLYIGGAKLMAYPVNTDGSLGVGADFPDQANGGSLMGTDGLGVDCAGNLYVTINGQGTVVVVKPSGAKLGTITVGSGVTNVAFGGADGKTLFITRMSPPSLYSVPSAIPGLPY
jgi:gluconolactonase